MNAELQARYDRINWRTERLRDFDSIKDDEWVELNSDPPFKFEDEIHEAVWDERRKKGVLSGEEVTNAINRIYEANGLPTVDHLTALGIFNQISMFGHSCGEDICHTDDESIYECGDCGVLDFSQWKLGETGFEEHQRIFPNTEDLDFASLLKNPLADDEVLVFSPQGEMSIQKR